VACAAASLTLAAAGLGHPIHTDHVEHGVHISVGQRNIDVTVRLQLNELLSLSERRRMDLDGDKLITNQEREVYLQRVRLQLIEAFRLTCDDVELPLIELYEPRLDLLGLDSVSPRHHVVELCFFARTPVQMSAGSYLQFEDRAYAAYPSLWFFSAEGAEGVEVHARDVTSTQPNGTQPGVLLERCEVTSRAPPAVMAAPLQASAVAPQHSPHALLRGRSFVILVTFIAVIAAATWLRRRSPTM